MEAQVTNSADGIQEPLRRILRAMMVRMTLRVRMLMQSSPLMVRVVIRITTILSGLHVGELIVMTHRYLVFLFIPERPRFVGTASIMIV